jgi:hypothetical protein
VVRIECAESLSKTPFTMPPPRGHRAGSSLRVVTGEAGKHSNRRCSAKIAAEPRSHVRPFALDGAHRNAKMICDFGSTRGVPRSAVEVGVRWLA